MVNPHRNFHDNLHIGSGKRHAPAHLQIEVHHPALQIYLQIYLRPFGHNHRNHRHKLKEMK